MRLGRVRAGELVALAGAACVLASLFARSYEGPSGTLDAWDTFGPGVVLLALAALAALALFLATVGERSAAIPVALEVWTIPLAVAALVAAIVRALERPDGATAVCVGVWLALGGAALILLGACLALHDEHSSSYAPASPDPRPRP